MKAKRTRICIALAACALALPLASAPAMQEIGDIVRQVDIMARVLETRLQQELGDDLVTGGIFERGGVRGAWVPGVGVVFQAKVKFALAERKPAQKPDKPDPNDLWSQMERGKPSGRRGPYGGYGGYVDPLAGEEYYGMREAVIGDPFTAAGEVAVELSNADKRKIQKMEDTVVETLAKYADRMTDFGPDDQIVVLVSGSHGLDSRHNFRLYGAVLPEGVSQAVVEYNAEEKGAELARLQNELDRMNRDLAEMQEKMSQHPDADDLKSITKDYTARLQEHQKKIDAYGRAKGAPKSVGKQVFTTRVVAPGQIPATSWVLKVKKGDCVKSTSDLRKKAEINAY